MGFLFELPDSKKAMDSSKRTKKSEPIQEVIEPQKKKRGRPKKNPEPVQAQKKDIPKKPIKQDSKKKDAGIDKSWKPFTDAQKPPVLAPCQFCVSMDGKQSDTAYGYISQDGGIITSDPFVVAVLRKRYGNLYYREVKECPTIFSCPNQFPDCEHCRGKQK